MNLRDAVCALLAQAREAGREGVVSIAAVQDVVDRYDVEQRELADRVLQRMHDGREAA